MFGCTPSFLCHFLSLFLPTSSLSSTPILQRKNIFAPENRGGGGGGGGGGLCVCVGGGGGGGGVGVCVGEGGGGLRPCT